MDQNTAVPALHPVKNKQIILTGKFLWLAIMSLNVEDVVEVQTRWILI